MAGKSSKKGKKKKKTGLSREQKLKLELDRAVDALSQNSLKVHYLLRRVERWMLSHESYLIDILYPMDVQREGSISTDQFKAALLDMKFPCNNVETHLLCSLLDSTGSGTIQYPELVNTIQVTQESLLAKEEQNKHISALEPTIQSFDHCVQCSMAMINPTPIKNKTFLRLDMRFIPFVNIRAHCYHVNFIFCAQFLVDTLVRKITDDLDIASNRLIVYRDVSRSVAGQLPVNLTLEECGYQGDTVTCPTPVKLYYDYLVDSQESPVLNTDNFHVSKEPKRIHQTELTDFQHAHLLTNGILAD